MSNLGHLGDAYLLARHELIVAALDLAVYERRRHGPYADPDPGTQRLYQDQGTQREADLLDAAEGLVRAYDRVTDVAPRKDDA